MMAISTIQSHFQKPAQLLQLHLRLHVPLRFLPYRLHARLQLPLVQQAGQDVAQVSTQLLDAPLAVAGILRMYYTFLPELLKNLADLLQASVQEK
jgi:hypothetical protein